MNHDTLLKELDELHIDYNGTTEIGDYVITVDYDQYAESPREWDNLGQMVCWHNRYDLGEDHGFGSPTVFMHVMSGLYPDEITGYLTDEQIERCYKVACQKNVILPLYLYDHSGITMRCEPFACPWDSGQVGFIFVSHEDIRKEYGWKRLTKQRLERIVGYLENEVKVYDMYLTGQVYGFIIEKGEDEEHVDSCIGFYGHEYDDDGYMVSVIKDAIKYDIEHTPQQTEMPLHVEAQL